MALKSTIYKATLALADMDRPLYADHSLTLALHPSETEERLMVRLLAFALQAGAGDSADNLQFTRGLSDSDEPALWQRDLDGRLRHWIEIGQTDERRLAKACGRADRVTLYAYGNSVPIWWAALQGKITRLRNLHIWQLPAAQTQELATLAARSMQLQVTVQDGHVWVGNAHTSVELSPQRLWPTE
ncbi:YaeQ family protein [Rubrivivax gelatinosus]|uniref:YaeQ family protein n=1 Tax=Rubrivivax gelatinosus TaxID=28068 RepID=A0ABS1DWQ7_RUBGE|nr:YaeQ family protein [Rubrivivax gelatinosus]MBK1713898.1 hypothetical protein [Rubrivivax gelatinosus]